jgi:NAD-dependent SIR2 family protein deacetylase
MFSMKCPKCGAESKFSFVNNSYEGPRRCWKCRELFKMKILNNVLIYCEPLSEEEFKKLQEINALKSKLRNQSSD